jgi:hypothetical protein
LQALQVAREGSVDPDEAYQWELQRKQRDLDGSYRELERALDRMQIDWPIGRSVVNSIYLVEPAVPYSAAIELGCVLWIAARMPHKIRIPKRYYQAQQEQLRGDVRALRALGRSDAEIAAELQVPVRFVTGTASTLRVSSGTASGDRHASGPLVG